MKNNVYTLYNKLSARYGDVVVFATDGLALARLSQNLPKSGANLEELEVCRIGSIDIESGELIACSPVRLPWSLPVAVEKNLTDSND